MSAESDDRLVEATRHGDREAFGELVERHQRGLLAAAHHIVRDYVTAQDLAQEAFIDAYRQLTRLRDRAKFKGYLFSILHNKCLKFLARQGPETVSWDDLSADDWLSFDDNRPDESGSSDLAALLHRLPREYREVLAAKYLHELSYEDIAKALGTTVGNVRVRCCRAKEKLRELLKQREGVDNDVR